MGIFRDRNGKSQRKSVQADTRLVFFKCNMNRVEQSEKDEKIRGVHRRHD